MHAQGEIHHTEMLGYFKELSKSLKTAEKRAGDRMETYDRECHCVGLTPVTIEAKASVCIRAALLLKTGHRKWGAKAFGLCCARRVWLAVLTAPECSVLTMQEHPESPPPPPPPRACLAVNKDGKVTFDEFLQAFSSKVRQGQPISNHK